MRCSILKSLCLSVAFGLAVVFPARGLEVKDEKHGFHLTVSDDFTRKELDPADKETLYQFIKEPAEAGQAGSVIQIQGLGGVIPLKRLLKASDFSAEEGNEVKISETMWRGHKLSLLHMTVISPEGIKVGVYTIQFPLSGEAVQLQVGGAVEKDAEIRALFDKTAASFTNTKPLHGEVKATPPAPVSSRELTEEERLKKMTGGIFKMSVAVLLLAIVVRGIFRAFRGLGKKRA